MDAGRSLISGASTNYRKSTIEGSSFNPVPPAVVAPAGGSRHPLADRLRPLRVLFPSTNTETARIIPPRTANIFLSASTLLTFSVIFGFFAVIVYPKRGSINQYSKFRSLAQVRRWEYTKLAYYEARFILFRGFVQVLSPNSVAARCILLLIDCATLRLNTTSIRFSSLFCCFETEIAKNSIHFTICDILNRRVARVATFLVISAFSHWKLALSPNNR